jgi:hypothetical protein
MSTILDLLSIVLAVLAVGLAYAIATDPREPVGRPPGLTRFGMFLVVAGGAGLLFRYLWYLKEAEGFSRKPSA